MLLASLCVHGHSIPTFRFSWLRTKKCTLQGSYAGKKRGEGPLYFALFIKDEDEMEKPPDLKDQAAGVQKDEPREAGGYGNPIFLLA